MRGILHKRDFAAWAEAQAEALRSGRLDALDLVHLPEEIGDLSNRERDALESHLEPLVIHLLKWRYQPDRRSRSWEATIRVARRNIAKLLRRSPSLRRGLGASLDEIYPHARVRAAVATRRPDDAFHDACPFTAGPGTCDRRHLRLGRVQPSHSCKPIWKEPLAD